MMKIALALRLCVPTPSGRHATQTDPLPNRVSIKATSFPDPSLDQIADLAELIERHFSRIWDTPVDSPLCAKARALISAAHRDGYVVFFVWKIGQPF
jgi:hypothetical protein